MHAGLSAVLDSNVLISLLVFEDPRYPRIAAAWRDGALRVLTDDDCAAEFQRVLAYPQLNLTPAQRSAVRAAFESRVCRVEAAGKGGATCGAALPRCADADDQKFLELAARSGADCLVTGDRKLLKLARGVRFAILTADALERRLAPAMHR